MANNSVELTETGTSNFDKFLCLVREMEQYRRAASEEYKRGYKRGREPFLVPRTSDNALTTGLDRFNNKL